MTGELGLFAAGLVALTLGADWLVSGSSRLADSVGVPPLVTGLTVVAFGTSAPEFVVSVDAAGRGEAGLAVGNVMGSTVANVGLIVGLCALFAPVAVHRRLLARETPLVVLVLAAVTALAGDASLERLDGLALLAAFFVYLFFLLRWGLRGELGATGPADPETVTPAAVFREADGAAPTEDGVAGPGPGSPGSRLRDAGWAAAGLVGLLVGAHWLVDAASALARALGVPEAVIGASLVAVGTSLPELASSVAASVRGLGDVAVGNVVGSNVFNLGFVLGAAAVVRPLAVGPELLLRQVVPALAFSLLLIPLAYTGRRMSRGEGGLLLAAYGGFLVWIL